MIRLVLFDALHTLVTPRLPLFAQYAQVFDPFFGPLDVATIKSSFKSALTQVQLERPAYRSGAQEWWGEVIRRTALYSGVDAGLVERSYSAVVPILLNRFNSKEGYKLFDDSVPTLHLLNQMNIRTGLVSNTDDRMLNVLKDLDATRFLNPILISSTELIEKPSPDIFLRACDRAGVQPQETLHVGDDLEADYKGASDAGLKALLLRRPGPEGDGEHKSSDEDLAEVQVISTLTQVINWIEQPPL